MACHTGIFFFGKPEQGDQQSNRGSVGCQAGESVAHINQVKRVFRTRSNSEEPVAKPDLPPLQTRQIHKAAAISSNPRLNCQL